MGAMNPAAGGRGAKGGSGLPSFLRSWLRRWRRAGRPGTPEKRPTAAKLQPNHPNAVGTLAKRSEQWPSVLAV